MYKNKIKYNEDIQMFFINFQALVLKMYIFEVAIFVLS